MRQVTDAEAAAFLAERAEWLAAFARRHTSNREDAEDLAQEARIRFWRVRDVAMGDPASYLARICTNLCRDRLRREARRVRTLSFEDVSLGEGLDVIDAIAAPAPAASEPLEFPDGMSQRHRDVLRLRFEHELAVREIAEFMRITEGAARCRVHHALCCYRRKLRLGGSAPG